MGERFQQGGRVVARGHHVVPDGTEGVVLEVLAPASARGYRSDEEREYLVEWQPWLAIERQGGARWPLQGRFLRALEDRAEPEEEAAEVVDLRPPPTPGAALFGPGRGSTFWTGEPAPGVRALSEAVVEIGKAIALASSARTAAEAREAIRVVESVRRVRLGEAVEALEAGLVARLPK